jgi:heavy metal efflux system protein
MSEMNTSQRLRLYLMLNVRGRDIGSFVKDAQAAIDEQVNLPPGYYLTWGGTFENLRRASARLLIVVPLALFLILSCSSPQSGRSGKRC